jgi:outer membrane protein assembly factor BamE (lipoprotein component of BamABCDE complex)
VITYKRSIAAILITFALSGCQTTRYVTVPCVSKDQALPAEPERVSDKLTGNAEQDVKTIAGSAVRLRAYAGGLRNILEGCRER